MRLLGWRAVIIAAATARLAAAQRSTGDPVVAGDGGGLEESLACSKQPLIPLNRESLVTVSAILASNYRITNCSAANLNGPNGIGPCLFDLGFEGYVHALESAGMHILQRACACVVILLQDGRKQLCTFCRQRNLAGWRCYRHGGRSRLRPFGRSTLSVLCTHHTYLQYDSLIRTQRIHAHAHAALTQLRAGGSAGGLGLPQPVRPQHVQGLEVRQIPHWCVEDYSVLLLAPVRPCVGQRALQE
jgi:hypothetical protein